MTNNAAQSLARLHAAQQSFYGGGDDGPVREVLCPDVVWVVPGTSPIAGRHVGVEAVMAYFTKRRELAANTFRMRPAELLAGDGDRVAMVTYGTATIDGREQSWGTVGLYRLRGRRIAECHLLPFDQAQFDRIWTPAVYDEIGAGYVRRRQPDPRIAAAIHGGLGDARTVVNVGAGTGSYEPADRYVVAVEPSRVMAAQRPPGSAPVVVGSAANLPLADATVDAAMTAMSLHHWPDWRAGLAEMRRVARDRVVLFTWDPGAEGFWLTQDYLGWLMEWDARRFPTMHELVAELGDVTVAPVPIPRDCSDGFLAAYFARPEQYLDPEVREAMSLFALAPDPERLAASLAALEDDLRSGTWDARHGSMRQVPSIDAGYRLVVADTRTRASRRAR